MKSTTPDSHNKERVVEKMVFKAKQAKTPSRRPQLRVAAKNLKCKLSDRKSTPTPRPKGNGRKRLILSLGMEDKQIRKKISFGGLEEGDSPIFTKTLRDGEESEEEALLNVGSKGQPNSLMETRSEAESTVMANEGRIAGHGDVAAPISSDEVLLKVPMEHESAGMEIVVFPDLVIQTNLHEESQSELAIRMRWQYRWSHVTHYFPFKIPRPNSTWSHSWVPMRKLKFGSTPPAPPVTRTSCSEPILNR